ncbi:MAG TPA: ATP-binding protein [Streptosporangiaceae bacterium]|nr:ATP-binding protein [Streptosporangiaceae bacterium]
MTQRLWAGLAAFAMLLAGAGVFTAVGMANQAQTIDTLSSRIGPLQSSSHTAQAEFGIAQAVLRAALADKGAGRGVSFTQYQSSLDSDLSRIATMAQGSERADVSAARQASTAWFNAASAIVILQPGSIEYERQNATRYASVGNFYAATGRLEDQLLAEQRNAVGGNRNAVVTSVLGATAIALVLVLLALVVAAAAMVGILRPLRGFSAVLRRLTSGDHAARADVSGPTEIAEVATSLNELAEESDRLRAQEAEADRLKTIARDTGLRIREHLRESDLLREARVAIEENLDADAAYLHVMSDGEFGVPEGHHDWPLQQCVVTALDDDAEEVWRDLLRRQAAMTVRTSGSDDAGVTSDDVAVSSDGAAVSSEVRKALVEAGVAAAVLVPFGVGEELLGLIVVTRNSARFPWTAAEVDALESIAADLGRGMHHARLYEAENRLVEELRSVDRAKSDFLAAVSHELRTPLTSIAGYIEILRSADAGPLTRTQEKMLETADRNTARLRQLIEDVLTLSKVEARAFKTMRQPVDLSELVVAAVTTVSPAATARGVSVTCGEVVPGLTVGGDSGQLDRLLTNLLSNSVKFTTAGGLVQASAWAEGTMAVLSLTDSGIGIPEEEQKALFTRFFRASNAVELAIPGTGLGLAIARTIVANHGGELRVSSQEGKGTTVTVLLPLTKGGGANRAHRPKVSASRGGRQR